MNTMSELLKTSCTCGHTRGQHCEEPPYECQMAVDGEGEEFCNCQSFAIPPKAPPDLLSLGDALAEAARKFNDAMNGFGCDGEQLRDLSNALKERIEAWDAARKQGG